MKQVAVGNLVGDVRSLSERETADRLIRRYLRDEPALTASQHFGAFVRQGMGKGHSLMLGDQSEIALASAQTETTLDYRMALLAERNDTVVVRKVDPDFGDYLTGCLDLDGIDFVETGGTWGASVASACRTDAAVFARLRNTLAAHGEMTLLSYLTSGNVWRLAQALAESERLPVFVAGPTPRISQRSNNKLWFTSLARDLLGRDAVPPTLSAYGPAAAAALAAKLAGSAPQVVVKVPDSAGSAGNIRIASSALEGLSLAEIRAFLLERLVGIGWSGRYPILIGVWENNVTCSPSAQLWIPDKAAGPPVVEAVMEQRVLGKERAFVGGLRSDLPQSLQKELAREAFCIGFVLQHLGFFGRCSMDAVLRETDGGETEIHWIECNGRWGGMSIPLSAAAAFTGGVAPDGLVVVQELRKGPPAIGTSALIARLGDLLFRRGVSERGIVVLSPSDVPHGTLFNFMALAETPGVAEGLMREARHRLGTWVPAIGKHDAW